MLQPMATVPLRLEVLLKLKPNVSTYGYSPLHPWVRARTNDKLLFMAGPTSAITHKFKDFLGWAPLTHIVDGFRAEW